MKQLVLIRHARVTIEPDTPPASWELSSDGQCAARRLAQAAALRDVTLFATSPEPKARATALGIAHGRRVVELAGLSELDRSAAGWIGSESEYLEFMREVFGSPDYNVRGCESAAHAQRRMVTAVSDAWTAFGDDGLGIVSHGIVLSLYVAHLKGQRTPDLDYWRSIRLPDVAVVDPIGNTVLLDFGTFLG
jgi:broad specificity phosphatase PhoE